MKYSEVQIRRITCFATDQWVCDDAEESDHALEKILRQVESPFELHQMAANFNWDTGHGPMEKIIEHPFCEKGTALMIYFLGKPEWYYRHLQNGRPLIGDQPVTFEFLKKIEEGIEHGRFEDGKIKFDPRRVRNSMDSLGRPGAELVPPFMKCTLEAGEDVEVIRVG